MPNYRLTNEAVSDLESIWNYTADEWSEAQADSYYEMVVDTFDKIAKYPKWYGKKYDEIRKGLLGCKIRRHIIFYLLDDEGMVLIIRILHEKKDLKSRL